MTTKVRDVTFVHPVSFIPYGGDIAGALPDEWTGCIGNPDTATSVLLTHQKTGRKLRIPTSNVRSYELASRAPRAKR